MKRLRQICMGITAAAGMVLASPHASKEADGMYLITKQPVPSEILMRSYRFMGGLKHFRLDALTLSDQTEASEGAAVHVVTFTHKTEVNMVRPYKLRIKTRGDIKNRNYFFDRGSFVVYDSDTGYYGTLKVPAKIDAALDYLFDRFHVKTALANLLYSDLYRRIPPKNKGVYLGISRVGGIACHHLAFASDTHEYQVWVGAEDKPLIYKFIIIDKTLPYMPRSVNILKWDISVKPKAERFMFVPPEGAVKIDILPADKIKERP